MADASFDSLCTERDALRNYVLVHAKSLRAFKEEGRPWYRREETLDEDVGGDETTVRHLTTTASCLESLSHVPAYDNEDPPPPCPRDAEKVRKELNGVTSEFTTAVLQLRSTEWRSENQMLVYSRVRTLPVILSLADDDTLKPHKRRLTKHLRSVWRQLDISDIKAQGIAEQPKQESSDDKGYPPNAFHTYWAIRLLQEYKARFGPQLEDEMNEREAVAQLWARRTLAAQTALISGGQRTFDAHQLAWALSADVLCRDDEGDRPTTADRQHVELYDAALAAFFSEQKDGRWRLYEPLFHYLKAGNAYCYTYETLAELLRLSLQKDGGRVLRDHLRGYATNLIAAWHYARDTALDLESGGLGWCSGHHPHRTRPEAWATASVFSYLQNLRCLIGHWTAEEAKRALPVQPSDNMPVEAGEELLAQRGATWHRKGTQTVGRQLTMLFLHPLKAAEKALERAEKKVTAIDPDRPLVDESRSAVLFGPPGTSKTTVVQGLAAALDWDYVEIHASHFLSEGMDRVPAQADAIFRKLMELDRCVILFDEIDELIRLRQSNGTDPFGRFLTTSMLPKLAKLWSQRRVLFFVATNDIEAADPAIKRSQRFDAAVFVPPPSFEKKKEKLGDLLGEVPELTPEGVEKALAGEDEEDAVLGVFALLRWDQIEDLAHRVEVRERDGEGSATALRAALDELGKELERTDWRPAERGDDQAGEEVEGGYPHGAMFERWRKQKLDERRDYRSVAVLQIAAGLFNPLPDGWRWYDEEGHDSEERRYLVLSPDVEGALALREDGSLELTHGGRKAIDRKGIFSFGPSDET